MLAVIFTALPTWIQGWTVGTIYGAAQETELFTLGLTSLLYLLMLLFRWCWYPHQDGGPRHAFDWGDEPRSDPDEDDEELAEMGRRSDGPPLLDQQRRRRQRVAPWRTSSCWLTTMRWLGILYLGASLLIAFHWYPPGSLEDCVQWQDRLDVPPPGYRHIHMTRLSNCNHKLSVTGPCELQDFDAENLNINVRFLSTNRTCHLKVECGMGAVAFGCDPLPAGASRSRLPPDLPTAASVGPKAVTIVLALALLFTAAASLYLPVGHLSVR